MEKEKFLEMIKNKKFDELEKELQNEYYKDFNPDSKYQLGICYGEQFSKVEKAKSIFKELMSIGFENPYIYVFNAKHTKSNAEKIKIINEGLKKYPDNTQLNNQLLPCLEDKKKEQHYLDLERKGKLNSSSIIEMIHYYYEKKDFEKINTILDNQTTNIEILEFNRDDINLIKILTKFSIGQAIDTEELNPLIISDNDRINGILLRLLEIDIISQQNLSKAGDLLNQVSYMEKYPEESIELFDSSNELIFNFSIKDFLCNIIDKLLVKFEGLKEQRKLKLIKSLHLFYWNEDFFKKSELRIIAKDIKEEIETSDELKLYQYLLDIYQKLSDNKKYFVTLLNLAENFSCTEHYRINFSNFKDSELEYAVTYIIDNIKITIYNKKTYQLIIELLIQNLFKRKMYNSIVLLADNINYKYMDYLNFGFELAYSYREQGYDEKSKDLYEEYIQNNPQSHAALNNLGVIYEKNGDFELAVQLYKKAENLEHDNIYTNNIKRCTNLIEDLKRENDKSVEAIILFENENIWVINELSLFYKACDENHNVICPYKRLPILLKCNNSKAQDLLNMFLQKNYIFRNKNHNYNTNSNVYKINTIIYDKIKQLEEDNQFISNFTNNLNNFTLENLRNIDYKETYKKLSEIKNVKVQQIFIRDYNELVYNYLSNQSKTVIVMSGTIIELLLLYTLELNSISSYKVGSKKYNKKIETMDITEMLEVCTSEKLIPSAPQKFIDGVKNFRNFVHPGRELREKLLEIDKQTVDLLMSMVRWLILTLNLN